MVEAIKETEEDTLRRPTVEEGAPTADWFFPDEVNLVNRAFEIKDDGLGLRYPTLDAVAEAAYARRHKKSRFSPEYLTEDLESISSKLRWTANLYDLRQGQLGIRKFLGYTSAVPLFKGLDVEILIQILHRDPDGLEVIKKRAGEQAQLSPEGRNIKQRDGEIHLILIPEDNSEILPSSDTKLKPHEVFVAASMLLDLDRKEELNPRLQGRLLKRLYYLGVTKSLESAIQATQGSKAELLKDPTLCRTLYAKLLAIADGDINASVLNRDIKGASVIMDVFWGVIENRIIGIEELREFLSPGFTIVQKPPGRS